MSTANLVMYRYGNPQEAGVYACRVPMDADPNGVMLEDKFLLWMDQKWWHVSSDSAYRGRVIGHIGPLQRRMGV